MATRRSRTAAGQAVGGATPELEATLAAIRKHHGDRTIVQARTIEQPYRIPTGIFTLDYALMGGIPYNRITMYHGPKHSGKTTGALRTVAGAQASMPGRKVAMLDIEGTFDAVWAEKLGVDVDNLLVVQPDYGEQAVDIAAALVHTLDISLIVADSVAALLPLKVSEASAEDSFVAQQSRIISTFLQKFSAAQIKERKRDHFVTLLILNQQRVKIGGWAPAGQDALSLPGGRALSHYTSVEVRFKNKEQLSKDDDGFETLEVNEHAFNIDKNKLNAGMRSGEFRMQRRPTDVLNEGDVDDAATMITFAKRLGWYSGAGRGQRLTFADVDEQFGNQQGAVNFLYENRDIYWKLRCHLIADNARKQGQHDEFINHLLGE